MKTEIVVSLQVEGVHCWPDCHLEDVAFLRHPHRHMFHIRCRKAVDHENRDIEIILLKREITAKLRKGYGQPCNFGAMSCETIARILVVEYNLTTCEVLEDGENGAIVTISE